MAARVGEGVAVVGYILSQKSAESKKNRIFAI
jgi:hypothetical protein